MSNDPPTQPDAPEEEDLFCLDCGYNLRGLPGMSRTCPECGYRNEIDETYVAAEVVARMRRSTSQRFRSASFAACLASVFLTLGVLLGSGPSLVFFIFTALWWVFLRTIVTGLETQLETADALDSQVIRCSAWIATATVVYTVLAYIGWALRNQFSRWFGPEWRDLCMVIWAAVTIGLVALVSWAFYRRHKPRFEAAIQDHAIALAQRWHRDRLRQPQRRGGFR